MRRSVPGLHQRMCKEHYKRQRSSDREPKSKPATQEKQLTSAVAEENDVKKEAENCTEGWFLNRSTTARAVVPRQSASQIMQAAKKLVLVDEYDREYKRLQRPADAVAKTGRSLQLSHTLDDRTLTDDRKAREYVNALYRYLNTRKEVPLEVPAGINTLTEPTSPPRKRKTKKQSRGQKRLAWDQRGSGLPPPPIVWEKY